jgi:hypothetical protein
LLKVLETLQVGSGSDNLERPPLQNLIDREHNGLNPFPECDLVTASE